MTKVLLGFQLIASSLIHLFCCGMPLLISIGGGMSIFVAVQTFTPFFFYLQLIFFGFSSYQLYKPCIRASKSIRQQRIVFWILLSLSFALFLNPPMHWFKSEETKLKQQQMERFFKHKR